MRNGFSHHYTRPNDDEIQAAIRSAVVVPDTNFLLGFYRVSKEARDVREKILRALDGRLFVPYQVAIEFHRNRIKAASDTQAAFKPARDALATLEKMIPKVGVVEHESESAEASTAREEVRRAHAELRSSFSTLESLTSSGVDPANDSILELIEKLFDGRVGPRPSNKNRIRWTREFIDHRQPMKIPPGFADAPAKGDHRAAGDYLLWREVISMAKKRRVDVVLVTNDSKEDWWQAGHSGVPEVPHPLLVDEFRSLTHQSYYQLSVSEFIKKASTAFAFETSEQILIEEDDLTEVERSTPAPATRVIRPSPRVLEAALRYMHSLGSDEGEQRIARNAYFREISRLSAGTSNLSGVDLSPLTAEFMTDYVDDFVPFRPAGGAGTRARRLPRNIEDE